MPEQRYTYQEAAEKLGIAVPTLRRWVSKGHISSHRIGPRMVRFTDADLEAACVPAPVAPVLPHARSRRGTVGQRSR